MTETRHWQPMLPMNRRARRWHDLTAAEQQEIEREWPDEQSEFFHELLWERCESQEELTARK